MKTFRKNRKLLVDRHYQLRQAGATVVGHVFVAILMAVLLSWFYLLVLDSGMVTNYRRAFPGYVMVAVLLIALGSLLVSLRRSRRVAGMLAKLNLVLADAARGRFADRPLRFRRDDYFTALAEPLNACLTALQRRSVCQRRVTSGLEMLRSRLERGTIDHAELVERFDLLLGELHAVEGGEGGDGRAG